MEEARPEWEVLLELARRVRPDRAEALTYPGGTAQLREEIARVVPLYAGIEDLSRGRRQLPVRRRRCYPAGPEFPTADGKARFSAVAPAAAGAARRPVRRVHPPRQAVQLDGPGDARTRSPAPVRDAVLVSAQDAERLGIADGDEVTLRSDARRDERARADRPGGAG